MSSSFKVAREQIGSRGWSLPHYPLF